MTPFSVRPANASDAPAAVALLRASITELCVADHQNDPATLARWLRNKTTEHFLEWRANPEGLIVVAEDALGLSGVGSITRAGNLNLCYVRPGQQRVGVGRAMIAVLEAQAQRWGVSEIRLFSSLGARAFYEGQGYASSGDPTPAFGIMLNYPYVKRGLVDTSRDCT
jgi:GNAT superfamily N-acetyltransferase